MEQLKQAGKQAAERALGPGLRLGLATGPELGLDCLWMKTDEGLYKQAQVRVLLRSRLVRLEREPQVLELAQQAQERQIEEPGRRVLALLPLEPEVRVPGQTGQLERGCESVYGNSRALMPIADNSLVERRRPSSASPRQRWWCPRSR